ncbi:MAG TPA: hypothetical protein VJB16_04195 [archaeon]|nr:hypothetical protein [archaeon]
MVFGKSRPEFEDMDEAEFERNFWRSRQALLGERDPAKALEGLREHVKFEAREYANPDRSNPWVLWAADGKSYLTILGTARGRTNDIFLVCPLTLTTEPTYRRVRGGFIGPEGDFTNLSILERNYKRQNPSAYSRS